MIKRIITLAVIPAAALALALPASATTRPVIHGATTVCGASCDDVSGELLGPSMILNASTIGGFPYQGRKINLRAGGNSKSNEDFDIDVVGLLHQFCTASGGNGQIAASSYACLTLLPLAPSAPVFEANFTPNSLATSFCAGALAPVNGYKVRLEPCGHPKTWFVEDLPDADYDASTYVPLIYAADRSGSHPLVVTVREFSTNPAHQVYLSQLNLTGSDGAVSSQLVIRPVPPGPFS